MQLTRHWTVRGPRWAVDGQWAASALSLELLLALPRAEAVALCQRLTTNEPARGPLLPPIEANQEVWASGVTYWRSRQARTSESTTKDVYERVYEAERPELFFKATGRRARGHGEPIRIRGDSRWHAPEPELTVVATSAMEVFGYTAGNDVSSRDIEGDNPLYLPQAKVFTGSCSVGPAIVVASEEELADLPIACSIERAGTVLFSGETRSSQMRRRCGELLGYLGKELDFPSGVLLMTGTGIVPDDEFSLQVGDTVRVQVGTQTLQNEVEA